MSIMEELVQPALEGTKVFDVELERLRESLAEPRVDLQEAILASIAAANRARTGTR